MLKVNFLFEVPLDASVPLPGVEGLEGIFHVLVELVPDVADVQIAEDFDDVSNFSNFGIREFDCKVDPVLLKA